jgi:hypothetical protein
MTRPTRNPLARYALALGFRLTPGRRHHGQAAAAGVP